MKIFTVILFTFGLSTAALLAGDKNHIHIDIPRVPAQPVHPAITPLPGAPPPVPIPSVAPVPAVTPANPTTPAIPPVAGH